MKNTFKIASLLAAAVMLFACEEEASFYTRELRIELSKDVILADGNDATIIKVIYKDEDVTSKSVLYYENGDLLDLNNGAFSTNKSGEYKIYADYGTLSTYDKDYVDNGLLTIRAIDVAVPESVVDPMPQKTSFVHRTFLTQYTGTGCGYCPYMIKILKELMADNVIPDKAVLAAVHSYGPDDPAYISAPRTTNYPYLTLDLTKGFSHSSGASTLKDMIAEQSAGVAQAGISVSPCYYEDENLLVAKVAVKAAVGGIYNVGAWLLEDDIYGQQNDYDRIGDESYNVHENCVRLVDSKFSIKLGKSTTTTYFGHELGGLSSGEVAEKTFVMNLRSGWNVENLHLVVFVSCGTQGKNGMSYTVCNAVDAPIDAPTPFEYAE